MGWGRGAGHLGVSWLWWFCVGVPRAWDLQVGSSQSRFCPSPLGGLGTPPASPALPAAPRPGAVSAEPRGLGPWRRPVPGAPSGGWAGGAGEGAPQGALPLAALAWCPRPQW